MRGILYEEGVDFLWFYSEFFYSAPMGRLGFIVERDVEAKTDPTDHIKIPEEFC